MTLLFQEFRNQLDAEGRTQGRQLTLSASCAVDPSELELGLLASTLDWVNIMTYDAHLPSKNARNEFTDFGAPTYASPAEPASNATWNLYAVVTSWLASGFPAAKLVPGISAYARTYAGVANSKHGLYQPYTGPGPGSLGKPGALEYKDLMANYLPKYESHWDNATKSSYLYSPTDRVWISFESVKSAGEKALYARQKGLGGLMLWELSADAPSSESNSPGSNIPALLDAIPFGINSLSNKVVLHATSDAAPALACHDTRLFLACKRPKDSRLQVMYSSNNGAKFGGTLDSSEASDAAPALVSHKGQLIIAWKGAGNNQLSVARVSLVTTGKFKIAGLTNKIILGDASDTAPALASHDRRLFLAWKGSGNDNLSVMFSSDDGVTFGGKYISPETSSAAPALASHNGKLMIAWKGSGNANLSVAQVGLFADSKGDFGIEALTNKTILSDTSDNAPALVSADRRLFLAWKGSGNDNLSVMFSGDNGASFGGKYISPETSSAAPALASDGSQIPIAWKGSDNENLSVAQIAFF